MSQSNQPMLRVGLESSTPIVCEECNNDTFVEVTYLRKISKLLTGSPQDMVVNIPAFACSKCGHINEQFRLVEPKAEPAKPTSPIIVP